VLVSTWSNVRLKAYPAIYHAHVFGAAGYIDGQHHSRSKGVHNMRRIALFSSCRSCVEYVDIRKISVKFAVLCLCEMFTDFDHVCDIGNIWIWFVNRCNPKLIYPAVFTQHAVLYSAYIRFLHIEGMYTNALIYFFTEGDFSF
jgi:hypothetical protein